MHLRYLTWSGMLGFLATAGVEVAFLAEYAEPEEVGFFRLAIQTSSAVALLIPGIFGGVLLPMMARAAAISRENAAKRFAQTTCYSWLLVAPLLVYITLFAQPMIELVYGREYVTAGWVLHFTMIGAGMRTVGPAAQSFLLSINVQRLLLITTIIGVVMKLTLAWLCVSHWGLAGAIVSLLTLELAFVFLKISLAIYFGGENLPWMRMFRTLLATIPGLLVGASWFALDLPLWTAPGFGVAALAVYAVTTLWSRSWTESDLAYLRQVGARIPVFGSALTRLLATGRAA